MTCIIFARHPYNKGDVQQQHVTIVHVTIGHFFGSGTNKKLVVAVTRSFVGAKTNIYNTGFKSVVKRKKNLPKTCSDPMQNRPRRSSSNEKSSGKVKIDDEYVQGTVEQREGGLGGRAGHSGGTEPIGSVPRFPLNFGS